jgi:hypothetical protein
MCLSVVGSRSLIIPPRVSLSYLAIDVSLDGSAEIAVSRALICRRIGTL